VPNAQSAGEVVDGSAWAGLARFDLHQQPRLSFTVDQEIHLAPFLVAHEMEIQPRVAPVLSELAPFQQVAGNQVFQSRAGLGHG
jgi:hypothetical protein